MAAKTPVLPTAVRHADALQESGTPPNFLARRGLIRTPSREARELPRAVLRGRSVRKRL